VSPGEGHQARLLLTSSLCGCSVSSTFGLFLGLITQQSSLADASVEVRCGN
jgi:hypothetical protein